MHYWILIWAYVLSNFFYLLIYRMFSGAIVIFYTCLHDYLFLYLSLRLYCMNITIVDLLIRQLPKTSNLKISKLVQGCWCKSNRCWIAWMILEFCHAWSVLCFGVVVVYHLWLWCQLIYVADEVPKLWETNPKWNLTCQPERLDYLVNHKMLKSKKAAELSRN